MKGIFGRGLIKKAVAILMALVLILSGASDIGAVDYVHHADNHHYLIYNDINALFEKMVIAYESDNRAYLGGNVLLPITENSQVTEGSEYLSDIQSNLADKYLVDTVVISDQLIVYLTANVETYEFYLLVYNETESEHTFTLIFANGVEFGDVATGYSFTLTEEVLQEGDETDSQGPSEEGEEGNEDDLADDSENDDNENDDNNGTDGPVEIGDNQEVNPSQGEEQEELDQEESESQEEDNHPELDQNSDANQEDEIDQSQSSESDESQDNVEGQLFDENQDNEQNQFSDANQDTDQNEASNENVEAYQNSIIDENQQIVDANSQGDDNDNQDDENDNVNQDLLDQNNDQNDGQDFDQDVSDDTADDAEQDDLGDDAEQDGSDDAEQDQDDDTDFTKPLFTFGLEIGSFISSLNVGLNTMTLRSQANTATATEFVYDSGELGPTISKSIAKNQDGTYTVTLTVRGNNDVLVTKKPINLVLALDVSNSMYWAMNNTALAVNLDVSSEPQHIQHTSTSPESRWRVLKRAVNQIVDDVLTVPGSQISIVMFSGDNAATNNKWDSRNFSILKEWSNNKNDIKSTYTNKELWELTYGPNGNFTNRVGAGGTNGEAGFLASGIQLGKVNNTNPNYVVYISDGIANRYLSDSGTVTTIRSDTAAEFQKAANEAIAVAKSIKTRYNAKIYTVGISNALTTTLGIQYCGYLLNPTGTQKYQEAYYTGATSAALSQVLTNITQSISGNTLTNLVVTDQLSEYVDYAGNLVDDGSGASIDADGKITWNVASALSASETRTLSYKVTVDNITAYRDEYLLVPVANYSNNRNDLIGYYTQDSNGKKLYFHSNEYAILHYDNINTEPKYTYFTHPSVEPGIRPNTLEIEKRIREVDNVPAGVEFEFLVKLNNVPVNATVVSSTNQIRNIVNGRLFLNAGEKVSINVGGRVDGTLVPYEVTEIEHTEDGIISELDHVTFTTGQGTVNGNKVSGLMGTSETVRGRVTYTPGNVSVAFINRYEPVRGTIIVDKSINDYYSAHGNPVFFYRLDRLEGNTIAATYYEYVEFDISNISNKVVNGDNINSKNSSIATSPVFDNLPAGTYILTEEQPIRYEFHSVTVDGGIADNAAASKANNGRVVIVINNNNTEVEVTYVNEKNIHNNFSHTDVVKNSINIMIPR